MSFPYLGQNLCPFSAASSTVARAQRPANRLPPLLVLIVVLAPCIIILPWPMAVTLHRPSNTCFLKLTHFSEIITKEIHRAIYKEGLDIQLTQFKSSVCQYWTKRNNNTITTCILANCPKRDPNICQKTYTIYRLIYLKYQFLYRKYNQTPPHQN